MVEITAFVEISPQYFQHVSEAVKKEVCVYVYLCESISWWPCLSINCMCMSVCLYVWLTGSKDQSMLENKTVHDLSTVKAFFRCCADSSTAK